jgi:WASH complex subunit strumpellin
MGAWYDKKTAVEVVNMRLWQQLKEAVDIFGLSAIDRLFCFMIVSELQLFLRYLQRGLLKTQEFVKLVQGMIKTLEGPEKLLSDAKYYTKTMAAPNPKVWTDFLAVVMKVGQIQLIRRQIHHEMNRTCKFDSKLLANSLQALNQSLLTAIEAHYKDPSNPYPGDDNDILFELSPYLESAGFHDPLSKIYVTTTVVKNFSIICFLFVITQLPKLTYNKSVGTLLSRKPADPLDGPAFVTGCLTLLRQFHSHNTDQFLGYMGQYIRTMVHTQITAKEKSSSLSPEVVNALCYLEQFTHYSHLPRRAVEKYIPAYIFAEFRQHHQ